MSQEKQIYVMAAKQVSAQPPLSDGWADSYTVYCGQEYVRAVEPDYAQYFSPSAARRMGPMLKRALLTARQALDAAGVQQPEAIITGTGAGCFENTEVSLQKLMRGDEEFFSPTSFMQSTHNTVSAHIAIENRCHAYNSTYSQGGISFECALTDAFMQLRAGSIGTALVAANDEVIPRYFTLLKKVGMADKSFVGEVSMSMVLGVQPNADALCRVDGVATLYRPSVDALRAQLAQMLRDAGCEGLDEVDAVLTGMGSPYGEADYYGDICAQLFPQKELLLYKHLFGESYSASGIGAYVAAVCLHRQVLPHQLFVRAHRKDRRGVRRIACYNRYGDNHHSLILLSQCGR